MCWEQVVLATLAASSVYSATQKPKKPDPPPVIDEAKKQREASRSAKRRKDRAVGAYGSNSDVNKSGLTGGGSQAGKTLLG